MEVREIIINVTSGDLAYLYHRIVSLRKIGDKQVNIRSVRLDRQSAFICSRETPHKLFNILCEGIQYGWLCVYLCHRLIMLRRVRNCKQEMCIFLVPNNRNQAGYIVPYW